MIRKAVNLATMLHMERRSRRSVEEYQNRALSLLVEDVRDRVPFYKNFYNRHGLKDFRVTNADDLQRLPFTNKQLLRNAAEAGELWSNAANLESIATSGSSGAPFTFYVTHRDNQWRKAQYLAPYVMTGRRPWESILRVTGTVSEDSRWFNRIGLYREHGIRADAPSAKICDAFLRMRPGSLQGYPSALRSLAMYIQSNGIAPPPVRRVYTDSELLTGDTRKLLEQTFATDVIDVFGSFESENIACECNFHCGYHIAEHSVFLEVVDRDDKPVTDTDGEIVCTVFNSSATPFIRYRMGDIGRITRIHCNCGRSSHRLAVLDGRMNARLILPDGTTRSSQALLARCTRLFQSNVVEYQIRQRSPQRIEALLVVRTDPGEAELARYRAAILDGLPIPDVSIRLVDRIPRTQAGKLQVFVSDVPADGSTP